MLQRKFDLIVPGMYSSHIPSRSTPAPKNSSSTLALSNPDIWTAIQSDGASRDNQIRALQRAVPFCSDFCQPKAENLVAALAGIAYGLTIYHPGADTCLWFSPIAPRVYSEASGDPHGRKRMPLTDFRCTARFRVPFCDVDMLQHVNHAAYVVWAETVRCIYFDEVLKESLSGANGIILARLQFDYEQPLDYREEVAVACRVARIGRKSFDFFYEIWSETRQQRSAHGFSTMVAYNYEAKSSIVIPERWREITTAYEVIAPTLGS